MDYSYLCTVFMRSQRFIAFFFVLITVLSTTALNTPLVGKSHRIAGLHAVDSVEVTDEELEVVDSAVADEVRDSVVPMSESDAGQ